MQKKNQKPTKHTKQIIILIIAVILLLLLIFAEDIIKLTNKNKTNLAQNPENELINNEPNPPQLSAGMIPVKWDGTNWIITTAKDKDWYDYSKGKPAYIMLNDGTYQSELIRDMTGKKLASDVVGNDAPVVPPDKLGTIFVWLPRFAEGDNEEIGYLKEETIPSEYWTIPTMFSYEVGDETKPNYSLSGVWIEKDVDADYADKITEMSKEESIYGFIANTKASRLTGQDRNVFNKYIIDIININETSIIEPNNRNRIKLQIINTNKVEPIKAKITQNSENQKIEIRVTYTANGIREILDDKGKPMILTVENGIVYADTGNTALAKGTYKFTVVDQKGNKKELSITPTIDSLYKVAYINGTDNIDNTATYAKTQETITSAENALGDQLIAKYPSINYYRAITDSNNAITAIGVKARTDVDEQLYLWNRYKANSTTEYVWKSESATSDSYQRISTNRVYTTATKSATGETVTLSGAKNTPLMSGYYTIGKKPGGATTSSSDYYYWSSSSEISNRTYTSSGTHYYRTTVTTRSRGDYISTIIAEDGTYIIGSSTSVHNDGYWYTKGILSPKYTLYKYDSNLKLQSIYDVDSKVLTTAPINISSKNNNKVKLTLKTTGTDYKTYISNDNTNWQEVSNITSNTPKELNVDGWDNLYIKIETNTSRINSIDVAYYKD